MKKTLLILISILAISCSNDEKKAPQTDKTAITLVTGLNVRQTSDDPGSKLGNPNTLNKKLLLYPNPADKVVYILAEEKVTDIWFVPATPEKIYQDLNFNTILNNDFYSEETILANSNFSLHGLGGNHHELYLYSLPTGYYKIFVKIGGVIYWDNLYKYDFLRNEDQFDHEKNFWK